MAAAFQKFLKKNIDLSPLGIERGTGHCAYFCTPKGADIIGWTGVDGIHYCFIRGFGEMVFAVSPENMPGDYVHPVAENFADFLRLLLACGSEAALEQAWAWNQEQFDSFLKDNPVTEEQQKILDVISETMAITAIEEPFSYIRKLQAEFDDSKIRYTEDMDDPDMNPNAKLKIPEWKVYFEDGFGEHHGRDHAGKEIPVNRHFQWAGRQWMIPAVYSCSKGLVVDFCMRIEPEQIESENPLHFDFWPQVILNGQMLASSHGSGESYHPCSSEDVVYNPEAKWTVDHYGLDTSCGWMIRRSAFPWKTKRRPEIRTLSVMMEQQKAAVPGPHFHVAAPGDSFRFIHPTTGQMHTLVVQEYEQKKLSDNSFIYPMEFPMHYTAMSYTVTPEMPDGAFSIEDCADCDQPRRKERNPLEPEARMDVCCVSIIGGAYGPAAIVSGQSETQEKLRAACSSPHFEPEEEIEWHVVFHEKQFEDFIVEIINEIV